MSNDQHPLSRKLSRRDFNRLTAAAFSGAMAGVVGAVTAAAADKKAKTDPSLLLEEPHVCRGLNTCKGKGKGGSNACAGQGSCASAKAHSCHGENACKGQGGCGETAGQNTCKGEGNCNVPLEGATWKKARAAFEAQMKKAGKTVGKAPAK